MMNDDNNNNNNNIIIILSAVRFRVRPRHPERSV